MSMDGKVMNKSIVDHSFHEFTKTAGKSYRSVIIRLTMVFARFWNWDDGCFAPLLGEISACPDLIKNI